VLSWLLLAVLGIIWAAFLLPSWRPSPTSTVEEFEQKMNVLAEANKVTAGRWVLMPRQGRRFLGPQDRQRARLVRRRRVVFNIMLEVMGFTTLMGLFPPLRPMLYLAAVLAILVVAYVGLLLKIRAEEAAEARYGRTNPQPTNGRSSFKGRGNGYGRPYGSDDVYGLSNGNGHGNGHRVGVGSGPELYDQHMRVAAGVSIIDDDVHVVVRRSDEVDLQALRASNGSTG
jgi:hypothetical protein